ncbi:MAG: Holliday junction resolvase RuvX [Candidatus Omnitrophota bacterium]|nr:Holliday junction resolvase RuvX [Candidatus Omnitrophota bacterium]
MHRILALDLGEKRIGVAVSDSMNIIAQSVGVIERKGLESDFQEIKDLIKEYGAGLLVVGLPLNMDGTSGKSAKTALDFVDKLKKEVQAQVEMLDERLTTAQGERIFLEADISRKKRKKNIDKVAAQLILQNYLDSHVQKDRTR